MRRAIPLFLVLLLAPAAPAAVTRIVVNDMIHPITEEFIGRAFTLAAAERSAAVVIELSTPGGLDESTRAIVERILRSPVPVVVYVHPSGARAASAGFFILQAADLAAMAPGTNTGAAHPVILGEKLDDVMKMKLQNDAAAFMRTIAQRRGRNVAVAESAVREAKSFTEDEAIAQKLIEVVAPDLPSLLRAIDGREIRRFDGSTTTLRVAGSEVRTLEMTLRQRLLSWIMNPNIAFLLMSLGMLALWAEFNHPGAILPGTIGLIAILLAVFALNLLPTRFASLVLILGAFILFALEAKFTSYGIFGIGGVICMIFGALLLVDGPIPEMRVNLRTALLVSIPLGAIAVFLMTLVVKARRAPIATGAEGMIGEIGVARTDLAPDGKVFIRGELWNATAHAPLPAGSQVRVSAIDGLWLTVDKLG